MSDNKNEPAKEYDIYRDSVLRYLGYSNKLGESFRPLIDKKLVLGSYVLAIGYVFADATKSLIVAGDVVTWQLLAAMYSASGLGITAGAHRLWAHRSYKAKWPLRLILMIFNTVTFQDAAMHWVSDYGTSQVEIC